jgi:cyanophycin synthetase
VKIVDRAVYYGPNLYARFPVIRLRVELRELEEWPTGRLGRGFTDALLETLPGLEEHGCSYGEPGGFLRRLTEDEGTWLGHVLEHVAIELQNIAGLRVTFGKTRSTDEPGQYDVVYEYWHSIGRSSGTTSSATPSVGRSGRAPRPWWRRRRSATSRGCG